jgi:hypothetical protein
MKKVLFLICITVFLISCKKEAKKNHSKTSEGIITYEANYLTSEKENPIIALLPTKVELKFRDNNISLISEGYLGFFRTKFISTSDGDTSSILLKVLNKKLNYQLPKNQIAFMYDIEPPSKIEYLDSTKIIAGYECKMAKLTIPNYDNKQITIFYTNKIKLEKPNRNTPLCDIPAVLMQFETSMNNIKTQFTAKQVEFTPISKEEFIIPDEYIKSNRTTLEKYILDFN